MVCGSTVDVAAGADDLVARGFASRKAQRARIAYRDAGGEAFGGSFGRNTEQRIADHFSPVREALPLIDRLGRPRNHLCPRMCGGRRPFVTSLLRFRARTKSAHEVLIAAAIQEAIPTLRATNAGCAVRCHLRSRPIA